MADETDVAGDVARVLGEQLALYTLPANYWKPTGDQTHDDVAARCGPILAQKLAEAGLLRDQATIDALNARCRILVDQIDAARAQIATQEPAGEPGGGSGGRGASRAPRGVEYWSYAGEPVDFEALHARLDRERVAATIALGHHDGLHPRLIADAIIELAREA